MDAENRRRFRSDVALAVSRVMITRGSSDEDELANKFRTVECDLLCDHAADGEAEKINLPQPQSTDKGFGVFRHAGDGSRHLAG
jgi:hypothetical protein